jgi:hypothetical protein
MKRTFIPIVAALILMPMALPGVALAAEDSAGGTFTAQNVAPTVSAVDIYTTVACNVVADSMTPQTEYWAKVSVSDPNTLTDVATVKVALKLWAAASTITGDPTTVGTPDTQSLVILTCTTGSPATWAIDPAYVANTATWSIETADCVQPTLTGTSGDFKFAFKAGKVATEAPGGLVSGNAGWGVYAKATDAAPSNGDKWSSASSVKGMNWYGELAISAATIAFGSLAPNTNDQVNNASFSLTNIANGAYKVQLKSSSTWDCTSPVASINLRTSDTTPAAGELVLKAKDAADVSGSQQVTATYADYLTHTADSGPTVEAGANIGTNYMWLSLGSGIRAGLYSGTLSYQIANN